MYVFVYALEKLLWNSVCGTKAKSIEKKKKLSSPHTDHSSN